MLGTAHIQQVKRDVERSDWAALQAALEQLARARAYALRV